MNITSHSSRFSFTSFLLASYFLNFFSLLTSSHFNPTSIFLIYSCEADPEVLAKYVHALLKDDSDHKDIKGHCINELRDFLRDYTEDFVESLFEAIEGLFIYNLFI